MSADRTHPHHDGADRTDPLGDDNISPERSARRARRTAGVALVVAIVGALSAIAVLAAGGEDRWFGVGIAAALLGIGFALVSWSKSLPIDHEVVEQRHDLRITEEEAKAIDDEADMSVELFGRRPALLWLAAGALTTLSGAILAPLLSLGPRVRGERNRTSWEPNRRLVTANGAPIEAGRRIFDQLVTVFPEGATSADDSQVVLLRVQPELVSEGTAQGGALDGWIAYSKICTHLGCSVGLLGIDTRGPKEIRQLVCPCHQSVFDPLDQARPIGGPAPRPLPQLPLAVDSEGFLVATADFDRPVGPITWNEG